MSSATYLLDVNVLLALLSEDHVHHQLVTNWFNTPGIEWAICPFTEAGFLRNATAPRPGQITMAEAIAILDGITQRAGYFYLPATLDWRTACRPFLSRVQGTKQVTDAYLLGLAIKGSCILVTMDRAIQYLAGDAYANHVLLLNRARKQT